MTGAAKAFIAVAETAKPRLAVCKAGYDRWTEQ